MRMIVATMLGVCCLVLPVAADTYSPGANPNIPIAPATPENEDLPMPTDTKEMEYIAPSKDVPLYVPLTEDQQELPTIAASEGEDYVPGIEQPSTPPAPKAITDRVP